MTERVGMGVARLGGAAARSRGPCVNHDDASAEGVHRATVAGTVTPRGMSSLSGTSRNRQ